MLYAFWGTLSEKSNVTFNGLGKTHIKKSVFFFSGRTTKRGEGGNPPTTKQKNTFFLYMEKLHQEAA